MAEMFGGIGRQRARVGGGTWQTVPVSIAIHGAIVAVLVVVPLVATSTLPASPSSFVFAMPVPPPLPEMPRMATLAPQTDAVAPAAAPMIPVEAPPSLSSNETPAAPALGVKPDIGLPSSFAGIGAVGSPVFAGPPMPAPSPVPSEPVRPGGQIRMPAKIHDAAPVYPAIAQRAHVAGTVIIDAVIGTDGRVTNATVLRSVPLLDQAALDAVRQWVYTPTLLNGTPVAIRTTVTVSFTIR